MADEKEPCCASKKKTRPPSTKQPDAPSNDLSINPPVTISERSSAPSKIAIASNNITKQEDSSASMDTLTESSDLSYDPSSIIVSPITHPLSPMPEPQKSPQSSEPEQQVTSIEQSESSAPAESVALSEGQISSFESTDEQEDTNMEEDEEFYRSLGITSIPKIPDTRTLSPTLTCNEKLDPEREGKAWLFSETKAKARTNNVSVSEATLNDDPKSDLNTDDLSNESGLANGVMPITSNPAKATNACSTTYTFSNATNTTTATFADSSQAGLCLTTVAGSVPASLTASAPLFSKNASYTFTALNCNASSSPVVSGVSSTTKKSNIPAGSIYLPAQATAGEMKLPNSTKSVPMVMVPVPDGRTLMAIPMSSLNNSDINQFTTQANKFSPTSLEFLKSNPQLKGHNLNLSGTLLTIQIPSSVSNSTIVASSNNTTVTNTTSITLTGSKSSATTFSNTVKAASANPAELQPPTSTAPPTVITNPSYRDEVSAARTQQRNLQPSHTVTITGTPKSPIQKSDKPLLDEQAKKLLKWTDGVGTLDGCDFKFTLNEFGDLEVLDSDDEEENEDIVSQLNLKLQDQNKRKHEFHSNGVNDKGKKKARYEAISKSCAAKKVLPGSSLLSGGPDDKSRRSKPLTSIKCKSPQPPKGLTDANNTINMNWQHLIEKLMPQDRIGQFKMEDVDNWKPDVVKKFVDSIAGCAGNGCLFEYQQVCGQSLMLMNQRDLVEILNIKLGPAVKIYHAILLVKEQSTLEQSKKTMSIE